jgi:hypothetical protein
LFISTTNPHFELLLALFVAFGRELLVGADPGFAFGLAGARGHANPLEFALERLLLGGGLFFFDGQASLFLLQPRRVVPFPRDAAAAVEFEDPLGDVVEEIAIVRDGDDGSGVFGQMAF